MTRSRRRHAGLLLEVLESRINPQGFTVDDPGDAEWDSVNFPNDPFTTAGKTTLRSALGFAAGKDKSAEITFQGPMTINVGDPLPTIFHAMTVDGGPTAAGKPQVSILGKGSWTGFYDGLLLHTGSSVKGIHIAGFKDCLFLLSGTSDVLIRDCYIGTNMAGDAPGPGQEFGISTKGQCNNIWILNNVVSGCTAGFVGIGIILLEPSGFTIQGNKIGTDPTGTKAVPNGRGIQLNGSGDDGAGSKITDNTISGNTQYGIEISSMVDVEVDNNRIGVGTDDAPLPNGVGIEIGSSKSLKIGTTKGNVISGNTGDGVHVSGGESIEFAANFVGVTRTLVPRPNSGDGIDLSGKLHIIGRMETGKGNVVAANLREGIRLFQVTESKIQGNYIGTTPAGDKFGNRQHGIYLLASDQNVIGATPVGQDSAAGNKIAFNGQDRGLKGHGIAIVTGTQNTIRLNEIYMNEGLGIDLNDDYFDRHEPSIAGGGANNRQWHPTIVSIDSDGTVHWMLNVSKAGNYRIDIYGDPENDRKEYAEGKVWLESLTPILAFGHYEFESKVGVRNITATATGPDGNTSEFSLADEDADGLCDTWEINEAIDLQGDGTPDAKLPGADPQKKDLYVTYASMTGWGPVGGTLKAVQDEFADHEITLHVDGGSSASQNIAPAQFGADFWSSFHAIKQQHFAGGSSPTSDAYVARKLAYRFCLFAESFVANGVRGHSGVSEIIGNDFMVTLEGWFGSRTAAQQDAQLNGHDLVFRTQSGTFMHELGHALGISHIGPVNWNGKLKFAPAVEYDLAYRSVMNYSYQCPGGAHYSGTQILDYSTAAPDEWKNLWFAFAEHPQSSTNGDITTDLPDEPPDLPVFQPDESDLIALISPTPLPVTPVGSPTPVTVAVTNVGPATAIGSKLTIPIPPGITVSSFSSSQGSVGIVGNSLVATIGAIASFDSVAVIFSLTPGTTGSFGLSAQTQTSTADGNPGNETAPFTLVSVAGVTPAPTGLSATPGNATVTLAWSATAGAATYNVYRSLTSGAETLFQTGLTSPNLVDASLANGTTYFYQVTAVNAAGESPRSVEVSATPNVPPPPPPPGAAPPTLVGYPQFAVGGAGGTVRFYNPNGTERFTLAPFAGFAGQIRTAAGDFNGDGVADLVVGTGPGSATHVRILDGATQAQLFAIDPFEPAFTGGIFVAAGDLDGDGKADLAISPDEGGGPRVRVFRGNGFTQIADFFGIDDPNFRGGARANFGDLNGDGKADLLVAAGFGGGPRLAAFNAALLGPTGGPKLFGDFFVFEQTLRNGIFIAAGDLNGDGLGDVVAGGGPGGGPRVFVLSGKDLVQSNKQTQLANYFAGDVNNRGGIRVSVKDLDGDAKADLVVGAGTGAGSRVTGYLGANTPINDTPPELFAFDAFAGSVGGVFVG